MTSHCGSSNDDDDPSLPPWGKCLNSRCATGTCEESGDKNAVAHASWRCTECYGLGFTIPDHWLETPWAISFLVPDESIKEDNRAEGADGFLDMILGPVYPKGGYRHLPLAHPRFEDLIKKAIEEFTEQKILFEKTPCATTFHVRANNKPDGVKLTRHLRVVLLERSPRE